MHIYVEAASWAFFRADSHVTADAGGHAPGSSADHRERHASPRSATQEGDRSCHTEGLSADLWTGTGHLEFQSQPERMEDPEFHEENKMLSSDIADWFDSESKIYLAKLRKTEAAGGHHTYFMSDWVLKNDKWQYVSVVFFIPKGSIPEHPALAGFVFDPDYLKNTFFPQALKEVLPNEERNDPSHPEPAITVRTAKDPAVLAASACWDGGKPEVERPLMAFLRG